MVSVNKEKKIIVHTWDWKGFPNFAKLNSAIKDFNISNPVFHEWETGGDELCVIVTDGQRSTNELTKDYVDMNMGNGGDWIDDY